MAIAMYVNESDGCVMNLRCLLYVSFRALKHSAHYIIMIYVSTSKMQITILVLTLPFEVSLDQCHKWKSYVQRLYKMVRLIVLVTAFDKLCARPLFTGPSSGLSNRVSWAVGGGESSVLI